MTPYPFSQIAILGNGITAKAVRKKILSLGLYEVSQEKAELIVTSPGIPPWEFPKTTTPIISEVELAYRLFSYDVHMPTLIGITGTNGKSTVTAMISHLLDNAPCAGNFGNPLIEFVGSNHPFLVVELSSYQLEQCVTFRPHIGILLNITPDHLERHHCIEAYSLSKMKLFISQTPQDRAIFLDTPAIQDLFGSIQSQKTPFSNTHPLARHVSTLPLPGAHNQLNALAALLAVDALGMTVEPCIQKLFSFKGLPHRIEFVLEKNNRRYVNDSKGTNPDSTQIAIASFKDPIRLILGGKDKGLPLNNFLSFLEKNIASAVVYGEIASRLYTEATSAHPSLDITATSTLEEALLLSEKASEPGDIILLSPACSSFDQFDNYEQRGNFFKKKVHQFYG